MKIYYDQPSNTILLEGTGRYFPKTLEAVDITGSVAVRDKGLSSMLLFDTYNNFQKKDGSAAGTDIATAITYLNGEFNKGWVMDGKTVNSTARALDTVFQVSATKEADVRYTIEISAAMTLTAGQTGRVHLEISANGTTGWQEVGRAQNGNSGALTIGLALTQLGGGQICGIIPAGYYVRLRKSGTGTFTFICSQEVY